MVKEIHISPVSSGIHSITSIVEHHFEDISQHKSAAPVVDHHVASEEALLAEIGYKQELRRHYNTLEAFGIAFSIMGLLPSIASVASIGLSSGTGGLVWGWFIAGIFILLIGTSMSMLASSLPTSGGLYYWTNYYCPDKYRVLVSFVVGCSNSVALSGALCSITYGFSSQVLAAVSVNKDGDFTITQAKLYGVLVAGVFGACLLCCTTTQHSTYLQTISIFVNSVLIILFFIAVPIGTKRNVGGFNGPKFIFTDLTNFRGWTQGWSFMLSMMPAIWTICAFDSVVHMSEELKSKKSIPWGILGSISVCWLLGWFICIVVCACIKDGDLERVLTSDIGPVAQIIFDSLGKQWCVAFMSVIALGQFMMACSIALAASRQIWAFARDDGIPVIYKILKYVDPRVKVPINATIFVAAFSSLIGLLVLIDPVAANAVFSLAVAGDYLAWGTPVLLVLLPYGRKRFIPGPFHFRNTISTIINTITVFWIAFVITLCMFPDTSKPDKNTMNYTVVINCGTWSLSVFYFFVYGYKIYTGPKSNLELSDSEIEQITDSNDVLKNKALA